MSESSKQIKKANKMQRKRMIINMKICCFSMVANGDVDSAEKMEAFFDEARALIMGEFDEFLKYYQEYHEFPAWSVWLIKL